MLCRCHLRNHIKVTRKLIYSKTPPIVVYDIKLLIILYGLCCFVCFFDDDEIRHMLSFLEVPVIDSVGSYVTKPWNSYVSVKWNDSEYWTAVSDFDVKKVHQNIITYINETKIIFFRFAYLLACHVCKPALKRDTENSPTVCHNCRANVRVMNHMTNKLLVLSFLHNSRELAVNLATRHDSGTRISQSATSTVYPKKYTHGFCFAVLCCGYTLTDFPISIRFYFTGTVAI